MRKTIIAVAIVLGACDDPVGLSSSPELSIREARPVPAPPAITVASLGTLTFTGSRSNDAMGFALSNGATRSLTRVAGKASYDVVHEHPMTWTSANGMSPVNAGVPKAGFATGVSDNGIIVGQINTESSVLPFVSNAGATAAYLPVPAGTVSASAEAITANGQCIVGFANTTDGSFAILWRNGALEVIGAGSASSITNDCMSVVGLNGSATTWSWNGSAWIEQQIPNPYGTSVQIRAYDFSPDGQFIAGMRSDGITQHAVVWQRINGAWVPTDMPGTSQTAWSVDNSGRAVGTSTATEPMLWTRSSSGSYSAQRLPALEKSTVGWANAINELGQITGRIRTRKGDRAVLWTIN